MPKKRLTTNGNVFKRTDGRWQSVIWYFDEHGEKKRKVFSSKTKTEAQMKIIGAQGEAEALKIQKAAEAEAYRMQAAAEAAEEAVLDSMLFAGPVTGWQGHHKDSLSEIFG